MEVDAPSHLGLEALEGETRLVSEPRQDRRRVSLAGEAGRPRRRLRAEGVLVHEHHVRPATGQMIGGAGAERA